MFLLAVAERAGADGKENHAVIRYLVDLYGPRLVLSPQQKRLNPADRSSLYEGKTPLHQAILAHDVKLVQFFVERGADVQARCTGSFFSATSHAYYGEFPLSFAVCTGQKEVARFLAENGALLNEDHDVNCCYALHMAVMSDRIASAWREGRRCFRRSDWPPVHVYYVRLAGPAFSAKRALSIPHSPRMSHRHFPAVYDLLVDELEANRTLLNIRGETVGSGLRPGGPVWPF